MNEDHSRNGSPNRSFLDKITQFLSGEPQNRSELLEVLQTAQENELIDGEAMGIIQGALQVADMHVREIMVPLAQAVTLGIDESPDDYLEKIIDSAHSRFPVYGDNKDVIVGILPVLYQKANG